MEEKLFSDPGSRIKSYAGTYFSIGAVAYGIGGLVLMVSDRFLFGLLVAVIGIAMQYLTSLMIYAFGELVEGTKYIKAANSTPVKAPAPAQSIRLYSDELPEL